MIRFLITSLAAAICLAGTTPLALAQEAAPQVASPEFELAVYDVRDLIVEARDFPAPRLGLPQSGSPAPKPTVSATAPKLSMEGIVQQLRRLTGLGWPSGSEVKSMGGQLIVRQTAAGQAKIRQWLDARRLEASRLIMIEARFLTVPKAVVESYTDGLHIIQPERAQAILALTKNGAGGQVLSAPRVTAFDGQRANVTIGNQISYISNIEVKAARGAILGDPVISTLTTGYALEVRGRARGNGWIDLDVDVQAAELLRPIPEVKTRFGTVQVPEVVAQRIDARGSLPQGAWALVVGMTEVTPEGAPGLPIVVLVRAQPVSLEDAAPKADDTPGKKK